MPVFVFNIRAAMDICRCNMDSVLIKQKRRSSAVHIFVGKDVLEWNELVFYSV